MSNAWLALIVGGIALLVHAPARSGEFLWYDDHRFVVNNPHLEDLGNAGRFFTDLETTAAPQKSTRDIYRPLRTLAYALLVNAFGKDDAKPFHTLAIFFHALTAVLLALLLREAGLDAWPSACGALAFALHPLTVESTAWVCSLGDVACGLFALLAVLAHARGRWLLALLALAVALFWKEHAVVVPGIWLAWDFCMRREEAFGARLVKGPALGLALAIGFLVFRATVVGAKMSQVPESIGPGTMLSGLGWYAATILLPFTPTFDAHVQPSGLGVFAGVATIAVLAACLAAGSWRIRFGVAWFLLALVPVSNVFVTLKIPTADRFLYLPLMGLAFVVGELAARTRPRSIQVGVVTLALLALLTVNRIGDWSSSERLIEAGLRVNPKSRMLLWAEASRDAQAALEAIKRKDARTAVRRAVKAEQNYERYLNNSAPEERIQVWLELGRLKRAFGLWAARSDDPERRQIQSFRSAFNMYVNAFTQQTTGQGRVVEAEVREAAERIRELGMILAQPAHRKEVGRTIDITRQVLVFMRTRYGFDDRYDQARLLLVEGVVVRAKEPARARRAFEQVLEIADALDPKHELGGTAYLRAQARLYLGVMGGQYNVEHLNAAYDLYLRAARQRPELQVDAMTGAARAQVFLWRRSGRQDESTRQRAIAILQSLKKKRVIQTRAQLRAIDDLLVGLKG